MIMSNFLSVKHAFSESGTYKGGETALMLASMHGQTSIAKLLLSKGSDVNAKDKYVSLNIPTQPHSLV